jgi:hypothetical protein
MTIKAQTSPAGRHTVTVMFSHSRTSEGVDVAAAVRSVWPAANIYATLDDAGAVEFYRVVLSFGDSDRAADAAFRLRDFCAEMGFEPRFPAEGGS